MITVSDSAVYSSFGVQFVLLIRWILACVVACSRLSDSGEDVKVKVRFMKNCRKLFVFAIEVKNIVIRILYIL